MSIINRIRKVAKLAFRFVAALISIFVIGALIPGRYSEIERVAPDNLQVVSLASGSRIGYTEYRSEANRKDVSIVYLHGGPGGYIYDLQRDLLSRLSDDGFDVLLYDQVGSGFSSRLQDIRDYTMQRHLNDLAELIARLGNDRVILVGQSYGATIAVQFAADHPHLIAGIVLTSPGEPRYGLDVDETAQPPTPLIETQTPDGALTAKILLPRNLLFAVAAQKFGVKLISDMEADGFITAMEPLFTQSMVCDPDNVLPPEGGAGAFVQLRTRSTYSPAPDIAQQLRRHTIPMLITIGSCEADQWPQVQQYQNFSDRVEFEVIEGAGHQSYAEKPERYLSLIRQFVSDLR